MADAARTILLTEAEPRPARRGFLRTLITAPIAALATHKLIIPPVAALVTPESAVDRLNRHLAGVEEAFRDLFPTMLIAVKGNVLNGGHSYYASLFAAGGDHDVACAMVLAGPRPSLI